MDSSRWTGLGVSLGGGLLTGALLWLSFPPPDQGWLAFVALVPLFAVVLRARSWRGPLLCALVAGMVGYGASLVWLGSVSWPGVFGAAFFLTVWLVLLVLGARLMPPRARPVAVAALWVGLELVRGRMEPAFGWLGLGYTQWRFASLRQVASLGGVYAVSFVVVLVNAALACVLVAWHRRGSDTARPRALRGALILAVGSLAFVAVACGVGLSLGTRTQVYDGPVVGVVQPNTPLRARQVFARGPGAAAEQERKLLADAVRLSETLADRGPQLIAWPENTVSMPLNVAPARYREGAARQQAADISRQLGDMAQLVPGARFLVGAPYMVTATAPGGYGLRSRGYSVSAYYLDPPVFATRGSGPDAQVIGRYDKIKLVPFGEYVPYVDKVPFLARLTPIPRSSVPGTEYDVFPLPTEGGTVNFSALICYDDCFPEVTARFRRMGAQFMVNVTYEGWYYVPGELRQHLAMAVFRAVETRACMVRAANTGVSCFIDPRGAVYARLPAWEPGALAAPVKLSDAVPFYARHGDVFAGLCLAGGLLAVAVGVFLRRRAETAEPGEGE